VVFNTTSFQEEILMKLKFVSPLFILLSIFVSCSAPIQAPVNKSVDYSMISVSDLKDLLESGEDFLFVNVHIPLEGNIPGTDFDVPYNEIKENLSLFPENKDANIVIYCRSGSMGDEAAQKLADLGYTHVSNLEGGYNAWKAYGLPFED
jgi:rhodanese-related sulfurtransferase